MGRENGTPRNGLNQTQREHYRGLEFENHRIRELLRVGQSETTFTAVDRLWRAYRDLLDKVVHLNDDAVRDAQILGIGAIADDEFELTPAEAQAKWEREHAELASKKRRKKARRELTLEVLPEGAETGFQKQRRLARESAGFTKEQVAEQFGISMAYYESIEREGCSDYDMAVRLTRLFNCPFDIYINL
jgi:DNA-binding XRE family transcriptional regulator